VDGIKQANRLIKAATSWREFASSLAKLSEREKGIAFERLTQVYFQVKPEYQTKLKGVWLLNELPSQVRKRLPRLPNTDEGIDLIAETRQGEFWAIQCKFKGNSDESLTVRELSTFTNLAFNSCAGTFAQAFVSHTSSKPIKKRRLLGNTHEIGLQRWLELTKEHWQLIHAQIGNKPARPKLRKPRPHQREAIDGAKRHYLKQGKTRGKLLMPCGTGKSLTAFWITQALKSKTTLVVVPSLSLIKQSVEDWTREFVAQRASPQPEWLCVCSDESVGSVSKDEFVEDVYELGLPVTTDPAEIQSFLKRRTSAPRIVFVTYQSSSVLATASLAAKASIDLAILDEAHKTVGERGKAFSLLLDDKNLKIRRRLFMTATERVVRGANDEVFSMDSKPVFGECFYHLSFKKAIHSTPSIISDYKVVTIFVTEKEIAEAVQSRRYVSDSAKGIDAEDSRYLAAAIALRKCYREYGITHAVSFHRSIRAANEFADLQTKLNGVRPKSPAIECFHISSQKSAGERSRILLDFAESQKSLITNARCLTEGVDVPAIDCVLFADPRQSTVDIVQAVGRALRPSAGKQFGYVMLPLVVPDGMSFEEFADSTEFRAVARVITALSTQDERIAEEFRLVSKARTSREKIIQFEGSVPAGMKISLEQFADSVATKVWERAAKVNWRPFEEARAFARSLGLKSQTDWYRFVHTNRRPKDIPASPSLVYSNTGWKGFGDWLGTGNLAPKFRTYWPIAKARAYVRALNIKSNMEWRAIAKSGNLPLGIPRAPNHVYRNRGWKGFGDWLGTGTVASVLKEYRPFKDARRFVHSLRLKSNKAWRVYAKSAARPSDIPANPQNTYSGKGWKSYGDWLGTGLIATRERKYLPFEVARDHVRGLGLKSQREWYERLRTQGYESGIPSNPQHVYRTKGWLGFGDWLGTGRTANRGIRRLDFKNAKDFEMAREYARSLELNSQSEWNEFVASGRLPSDIPSNPRYFYRNEGWVSMGDWLGTGTVAPFLRQYRPFKKAREFVRSLKLNSQKDWLLFTQSGQLPNDIPKSPERTYKNKGWVSLGDWLGTGFVAHQYRKHRPFKAARDFARSLKLKSSGDWSNFTKSGKLPSDIPVAPHYVYRDQGWAGYSDWLGTVKLSAKVNYRSFESARTFVRKQGIKTNKGWRVFSKSSGMPPDIPSCPENVYRNHGWGGYGDWLGTGVSATRSRNYLPFSDARKYARGLGLKSQSEWKAFVISGRLPNNIPANPRGVYENKGWVSMGDWLGTGNIANHMRKYRSFFDSREFVRTLGFHSRREWVDFTKSGRLPRDIPANPQKTYKNNGWASYRDWLGY
jgi:superfamily II DNA or RNA helicase